MEIQNSKFYIRYLKGVEVIGGLSTEHHSERTIGSAIATFYVNGQISKYSFGYGCRPYNNNINDVFYPCPIIIGYLQLYEMKISEEIGNIRQLSFDALVLRTRMQKVSFTINVRSNPIPNILKIINFINLYLSQDRDATHLKYSFLKRIQSFQFEPSHLSAILKKLKFDYCYEIIKRVGKDDKDYTAVIIENIPNERYLVEVISKCVSNIDYVERVDLQSKKDKIIARTDERICCGLTDEVIELFLDMIKMYFFVYFKYEEYLISRHDEWVELET